MGKKDGPDRLSGVYGARDSRHTRELYDEWAAEYEQHVQGCGYLTPAILSGLVGRNVDPGAGEILDAGAGTGMIGEALKPLGYTKLCGIDLSERMLDLARQKDVYEDLYQMELGTSLNFPDGAFAAVVAAGVFSPGHAPPRCLDELIRITKPGGRVIFSVRTDKDAGFAQKQRTLEEEGRWRPVEATEPYRQLPLADPELQARCFVYRVI